MTVSKIYEQYLHVRKEAQLQCEQRNLTNLAKAYGSCSIFKGNETLEELAELFKNPKAVEFCIKFHFPSPKVLRAFKGDEPERFGIYIDAGEIAIDEPMGKIIIVGSTKATVECSSLRRYEIVCLHGAIAEVNASGFSVVRIEADKASGFTTNKKDYAIVLS